MVPGRSIEEVIERHAKAWMAISGVAGVYQGAGEGGKPRIVVMIRLPAERFRGLIPPTAEGYPVEFEDAADLRPM